jgi:hypothetical protein
VARSSGVHQQATFRLGVLVIDGSFELPEPGAPWS